MPYSKLGAAAAKPVKHTFILLLLSTRDRKIAAIQHKVTGREKGLTRLIQEEKTEALMNQPDICRRIRRCLAQQAGDVYPFSLLWDVVDACPGPNQVHRPGPNQVLDACAVPASKESVSCCYLNPMPILTATTSRLI